MNLWEVYYLVAVAIAFVALLRVPSRLGGLDNIGGSFVAALAFGWLLWPAFIYAAAKKPSAGNAR